MMTSSSSSMICSDRLPQHEGKAHLPLPRGPHHVGFVDVMTEGDNHEGVFFRLLYPTKESPMDGHEQWPVWADDHYVAGIGHFMKTMLKNWPSWAPRDEYYGVELLSHVSFFIPSSALPHVFKMMNGVVFVPIVEKADIDHQKWPLIIFSHGLGCARSIYSRICYDLVSYGFVVAAVEHRDGSACSSFYLMSDEASDGKKKPVYVEHERVVVNEHECEHRRRQLGHRVREVQRALDTLTLINEGSKELKNVLDDDKESSLNFLHSFKGAFDMSKVAITGHSFGGATSVLSLVRDSRFRCGIALDPWMFPLRDEELQDQLSKPFMAICTESFLHKDNLQKLQETLSDDSKCFVIEGSVHQNHLDVPTIVKRRFVKKVIGMNSKLDCEHVLGLNNMLMAQFLSKHLDLEANVTLDKEIEQMEELIKCPFKLIGMDMENEEDEDQEKVK